MSAPRLTSRFWVDAYLARLRFMDIPAFVTAHAFDLVEAPAPVNN